MHLMKQTDKRGRARLNGKGHVMFSSRAEALEAMKKVRTLLL